MRPRTARYKAVSGLLEDRVQEGHCTRVYRDVFTTCPITTPTQLDLNVAIRAKVALSCAVRIASLILHKTMFQ